MVLKSRLFILIIFSTFLLASINKPLSKETDKNGAEINWTSYSAGITQAKATNKALFLYFYTDWCFNCAKMEKETFKSDPIIVYLNANFISIRVKFDREQKIANQYCVRGIPTTVLIDPKGSNSSCQLPGFLSAKRLISLLKEFKRK